MAHDRSRGQPAIDASGMISAMRRPLMFLCVLALILIGPSCFDSPDEPTTPPSPPADAAPPAKAPPSGVLHVRVSAGTPAYRKSSADGPPFVTLGELAALPVLEKRDGWYRVRLPSEDGWVYLEDGPSREFRVASHRPGPQPSATPDPARLADARSLMGGGTRDGSCGPYRLLTDVADSVLLDACARLGTQLDRVYAARFGVTPQGSPGEVILLFRDSAPLRAFAQQDGEVVLGYAAHARASRGYVAVAVGDRPRDRVMATLGHELTHLVNRRALGANLPRWLSEGLADGLGDTVTLTEIEALRGTRGAEVEARRLRDGYDGGRAGSLARLVALEAGDFDRGATALDYEQSALFVRFLLLDDGPDRDLDDGFRSFLEHVAAGGDASPEVLRQHLGEGWDVLDGRLESWVRRN